jgi:tryptophan synthase beta chain
VAKELGPGKNLVLNLSGRGDKDVEVAAEALGIGADEEVVAVDSEASDATTPSETEEVSGDG